MITYIGPERGGESDGILRVEFSMPLHPDELRSLRNWFDEWGWTVEVDQIDNYFAGKDWSG
jgi:hypothetical protein